MLDQTIMNFEDVISVLAFMPHGKSHHYQSWFWTPLERSPTRRNPPCTHMCDRRGWV